MNLKVKKIIKELEAIPNHFALYWNVHPATAQFLNILIKITGAKRVLEIGTSNGYSGIHLAEALSHTHGRLYTVESHRKRFDLATINFKKSGLEKHIQQIFGHAPEILPKIKGPLDLVLIDATKMEYKSYLDALLPKIKKGGLIVSDNAVSHAQEMKDYLKFVTTSKKLQSVLLPLDSGLMLSYKLS